MLQPMKHLWHSQGSFGNDMTSHASRKNGAPGDEYMKKARQMSRFECLHNGIILIVNCFNLCKDKDFFYYCIIISIFIGLLTTVSA